MIETNMVSPVTHGLTIAVYAGNSIGGAEKAAVTFAAALSKRGHRLIYLSSAGPRDRDLKAGKVQRMDLPENAAAWAKLLREERVDLIHQHVPGYPHHTSIYEALQLLGETRPRLVETNIFGRLEDPEGDKWIDFYCFVSIASGVQALKRGRLPISPSSLTNKTVVYNPVTEVAPPPPNQRLEMRNELGLQPGDILILRIGRASKKWNRDEVRVFQRARLRNKSLRLLLMEPPADIWDEVQAGRWGEGILLHRALDDFDRLAAIYSAGDLMLHMAKWGESYGYTIAEAMQHGVPVITRTTPWGDNAQVELVVHGTTGLVCNSIDGAVSALLKLAADQGLREKFSAAGVARIDRLSDRERETDLLEEVFLHVTRKEPLRKVLHRNAELLDFAATFPERENKVIEAETSGLKLSYQLGLLENLYRKWRGQAGKLKRLILTGRTY